MNAQAELDFTRRARFNGPAYDHGRDSERLTGQLRRVWNFVNDGRWHSLREIADATGDPEASVSAQLRHLRKERFGAHTVERRHIENGLYHYRLVMKLNQSTYANAH